MLIKIPKLKFLCSLLQCLTVNSTSREIRRIKATGVKPTVSDEILNENNAKQISSKIVKSALNFICLKSRISLSSRSHRYKMQNQIL